jgi:hypothetical protein
MATENPNTVDLAAVVPGTPSGPAADLSPLAVLLILRTAAAPGSLTAARLDYLTPGDVDGPDYCRAARALTDAAARGNDVLRDTAGELAASFAGTGTNGPTGDVGRPGTSGRPGAPS